MDNKVILILVDGMRPAALEQCGNAYVETFIQSSAHCLQAATVMPSVTLPCHMSLFHSVDPSRHGILSNFYAPQVRPVEGLLERLDTAGKKCAMFYTWEELRDITRFDHLAASQLINLHKNEDSDSKITAAAIDYIQKEAPDFLFLYLGQTDEVGHRYGWMGQEYLETVNHAVDCVKQVRESIPADYNIILLADHGGHDRMHGTEIPEDMVIPILCNGPAFPAGKLPENVSIKDIAPTVAKLLNAIPAKEWEGKTFL